MPEVWTQMSAEKCEFALADYGMEKKGARSGLWSSQQDYVARLSQVFFEGQGRDGSLFTAPVNKNANIVSGGTSKLNKKHHATHQNKVGLDLIRKGEPHSMVDGGLVRDTIHLWWGINKEVTLADSAGNYIGDHYSILCGLRAQADLQQPEVSGGKSPIPQANAQAVRVTLYVRRK
ncbi:hypothetical protein PWT90_11234 [Aphanocladium album]|nr:hypothetical protein PWT90_11234 [Aphanocladium album]